MNAVLPVHVLSASLQELDCELRKRRQEAVDRPRVGSLYDIWP